MAVTKNWFIKTLSPKYGPPCNTLFDISNPPAYTQNGINTSKHAMELQLRKLGNSTGLTLPPSLMRELGLAAGQLVSLNKTVEGGLLIQPIRKRRKYMAAQLNAMCDLKAPMPDDLLSWDQMKPVGSEAW